MRLTLGQRPGLRSPLAGYSAPAGLPPGGRLCSAGRSCLPSRRRGLPGSHDSGPQPPPAGGAALAHPRGLAGRPGRRRPRPHHRRHCPRCPQGLPSLGHSPGYPREGPETQATVSAKGGAAADTASGGESAPQGGAAAGNEGQPAKSSGGGPWGPSGEGGRSGSWGRGQWASGVRRAHQWRSHVGRWLLSCDATAGEHVIKQSAQGRRLLKIGQAHGPLAI